VSALRKVACHFSPLAGFKIACIKPADPKGEEHELHATSLNNPQEHNPAQPLSRLNPTLQTKLKSINSEL
jgi:hypothetical protein